MSTPLVSVVIPTLNGCATLPALLDGLAAQRFDAGVEIIAIDSGSTDGTVELLTGRVDNVIRIAPEAFDHGLTRNLAVERAQGELVVLLVQDAVPASPTWLSALTAALRADASLAGASARQEVAEGASGITRYYHRGWQAASATPRVSRAISRAEFLALSPPARYERCIFDNVCSCLRRSVWRQYPFRATPIAEDLEWARDVLLAGYGIAYVPDAVVRHSHERSARHEYRRTYLVHQRLRALFDLVLIPDVPRLCRAVVVSAAVHLREVGAADPRAVARALALAVAYPLGQYRGAASAAPDRLVAGGDA